MLTIATVNISDYLSREIRCPAWKGISRPKNFPGRTLPPLCLDTNYYPHNLGKNRSSQTAFEPTSLMTLSVIHRPAIALLQTPDFIRTMRLTHLTSHPHNAVRKSVLFAVNFKFCRFIYLGFTMPIP